MLKAYGLGYLTLTGPRLLGYIPLLLRKDTTYRAKLEQVSKPLACCAIHHQFPDFFFGVFPLVISYLAQWSGLIQILDILRGLGGWRNMATLFVLPNCFSILPIPREFLTPLFPKIRPYRTISLNFCFGVGSFQLIEYKAEGWRCGQWSHAGKPSTRRILFK